MTHEKIKELFYSAVSQVTSTISNYAVDPDRNFTRNRKLPPDKIISFLVSEGSSSTKNELLDFFGMDGSSPSASALNQQRNKLKPEALEAVFNRFNKLVEDHSDDNLTNYRCIAADGSSFSYPSNHVLSSELYHVTEGHSAKGFYNMHLNAFFDLDKRIYTDAVIQPVHCYDEFRAFCTMVDRFKVSGSRIKIIFIGDRGYCSYNNMAHVIEKGQFFLFRTKDIHSKGLVGNFIFPNNETFDITVKVTLVRSHSKKISPSDGYKRFIDKNASFDYIQYGSQDTYSISFRIVRIPITESTYECILTNLPSDEFSPERIDHLYFSRWGVESSFRKLKHTIGLINFHSCKPEFVKQEIWSKLIAYNITENLITITPPLEKNRKYPYKVNFSVAAHISRNFIRPNTEKGVVNVTKLLQKELIPIRNKRQFPRLQTAHFRKPKYFIYRAA
jgi:hypothetical protein